MNKEFVIIMESVEKHVKQISKDYFVNKGQMVNKDME